MKILLVVTGLPSKKEPARSVFNLKFAKELALKNIFVTILYIRAITPKRPFIKVRDIENITLVEMATFIPKIWFLKHSIFISPLFKFLAKLNIKNFDVIHAAGGGSLIASYHLSNIFKRPLLTQFIGSDLNIKFSRMLKNKLFRKAIVKSSFLCFNSHSLEKIFDKNVQGIINKQVIYRGVTLEKFPYNFVILDSIRVLFLGGFPFNNDNMKGGITFIESIKMLDERGVKDNIHFIIGGPNSLKYKDKLKITCSNIHVDFIGAVSNSEVIEQLNQSHIVVIPSLSEGLPNVLFEAMASGNLIIGTNVGGIPEMVEDGKTGIIIEANNSQVLAEIISYYVTNVGDIEKFAILGRKKISNFNYINFLNSYIKLYHSMVDTNAYNK